MSWETVVGLEIHVQLKTRTKMFCRCANGFGAAPNTTTCPICLGHPGSLPVPNRTAVEWTIDLGRALGCEIAERAVFHRKSYFYPDLAKGYQISQYDEPLCVGGAFVVPGESGDLEVGIVRAHLEEDAAKTVHVGGASGRIVGAGRSLVDYNRGGVPLVEVVTQPDLHSADDVKRFLQLLRQTVVELGVSDAEMEKGTMRVDANVSVRQAGEDGFRTRWELKNMNSFNFLGRGIDAAVREQIALYEAGRGRRPGDVRLRRRLRHADAAPVEGRGGRLPLLPGARSRAHPSGRTARRSSRAPRRSGSAHPPSRARGRLRHRRGSS